MISTTPKMNCPWSSWTMPTMTNTAAMSQSRIPMAAPYREPLIG